MATTLMANAVSPIAGRIDSDLTDQLIEPFHALRTELARLFDSFGLEFPALQLGRGTLGLPAVEYSETDTAYKITAELAGLSPDDVDVTFDGGVLRIAGEKKDEEKQVEPENGYRLTERKYGSFERLIEIPTATDGDGISAGFRNGLLTVLVPKSDRTTTKPKKIPIKNV